MGHTRRLHHVISLELELNLRLPEEITLDTRAHHPSGMSAVIAAPHVGSNVFASGFESRSG